MSLRKSCISKDIGYFVNSANTFVRVSVFISVLAGWYISFNIFNPAYQSWINNYLGLLSSSA